MIPDCFDGGLLLTGDTYPTVKVRTIAMGFRMALGHVVVKAPIAVATMFFPAALVVLDAKINADMAESLGPGSGFNSARNLES